MTFLDVKASNRRFISYQLHGTWNEQAMAGIARCIIHHHTTQVTTVAQICQFPWLGDSGQLRKFNQSNGLNLIARAHQLVMEGFNWAHEQLLRSINLAYMFSTAETQRTADHSRTFRIQEHDANCIWHLRYHLLLMHLFKFCMNSYQRRFIAHACMCHDVPS